MSFQFLFSLHMAVNPLHGETCMSLPDIHLQKGPVPIMEFPAYAHCSGKGTRSLWSSHNMNQATQSQGGVLAWFL